MNGEVDSLVDVKESKVLGVIWNAPKDVLEFRAKLNFSPKQGKKKNGTRHSEE